MCPPGCHHNGFMATPELGHRMYGYTLCYLHWKRQFEILDDSIPQKGG